MLLPTYMFWWQVVVLLSRRMGFEMEMGEAVKFWMDRFDPFVEEVDVWPQTILNLLFTDLLERALEEHFHDHVMNLLSLVEVVNNDSA